MIPCILLAASIAFNILIYRRYKWFKTEAHVYRLHWTRLVRRQARRFVRAKMPKVGKVVVENRLVHAEN